MRRIDIVRRVAAMPCICHPMHRRSEELCLGDHARKLVGDFRPRKEATR